MDTDPGQGKSRKGRRPLRKAKPHALPPDAVHVDWDNLWRVRCDCGQEALVSRFDLESGAVTDCGCSGKFYHKMRITNPDDPKDTHLVISSKPLCPECMQKS
jgi:hypothetical protein